MKLFKEDVDKIVNKIPEKLKTYLKGNIHSGVPKLYIAGGFIKSIILNENPYDIDVFGIDYNTIKQASMELSIDGKTPIKTDNAFTLTNHEIPVQFITKYFFKDSLNLIDAFDYTICQAAIWYNLGFNEIGDNGFSSVCSDRFYADIAAKRLVYVKPDDNDVGGTILRLVKFLNRGYNISRSELSKILSHFINDNMTDFKDLNENAIKDIIKIKLKDYTDN
jgi:hypothetical protein